VRASLTRWTVKDEGRRCEETHVDDEVSREEVRGTEDEMDRAEAIEGIRRGLESAARGEGRPAEEVFAELRARNGLTDRS